MGLFNIFNKQEIETTNSSSKIDNVAVADNIIKIMTELGFSTGVKASEEKSRKMAQKIIDDSARKHGGVADAQEVYLKAIELVGNAETPREKRIIASAYSLCHTEYTLYAIKAVEDYIDSGFDFPDFSNMHKIGLTKEMMKREYIAGNYARLGQLYETNYDFDKALKCYMKELEYDDWSHFPYIYMSEVYRKMNEPDKAIKILEKAKTHPNYKNNEDVFYGDVVDRFLEEAKQRKAKGYVFRKRGHKQFLPLP